MRVTAGGVMRSSNQIAGRTVAAAKIQGEANEIGPSSNIAASPWPFADDAV
jgi:hypothetical protein